MIKETANQTGLRRRRQGRRGCRDHRPVHDQDRHAGMLRQQCSRSMNWKRRDATSSGLPFRIWTPLSPWARSRSKSTSRSLPIFTFTTSLPSSAWKAGVDCLRLNPGNLRNEDQVREVAAAAKAQNVPIRIGVNFGSLPPVGGIGRTRGFSRHMDLVNKLPKAGEANEGRIQRR